MYCITQHHQLERNASKDIQTSKLETHACKFGRPRFACQSRQPSHAASRSERLSYEPPPRLPDEHNAMPRPRADKCSFASRLGQHAAGAREKAIAHALSQMDLVMPYFAQSCVEASNGGLTCQRAGYPTRDWFADTHIDLLQEPSFREEFVARARARHVERLGACSLHVKWPTGPRVLDPALGLNSASEVLEVACDWSEESVQRNQPKSNVKGSCPVCLEGETCVVALAPCGHLLCTHCAATFRHRRCPICRSYCNNVQSLFSN